MKVLSYCIAAIAIVSALAGSLLVLGCETPFDDLGPDTDKYDFTTSCGSESELDACVSCCEDLAFDTALVSSGDCGCAYQYVDWDICEAEDGDSDACFTCCNATEASGSSMRNGECSCLGIERTAPSADRSPNRCENSGDSCRCSRDDFSGRCARRGDGTDDLACTCSF